MAGMLPGVECARRRRLHQSGDYPCAAYTRRSSFCLYISNHESHHISITAALKQKALLNQACDDEKLGEVAREAKERLDKRLRTHKKLQSTRHNGSRNTLNVVEGRSVEAGELQTEMSCAKKSGSKRFNWAKLSWKAAEQNECTICLEKLRSGETLVDLPCAHRFHTMCLVPWLENNAHCPCCRMEIRVEFY